MSQPHLSVVPAFEIVLSVFIVTFVSISTHSKYVFSSFDALFSDVTHCSCGYFMSVFRYSFVWRLVDILPSLIRLLICVCQCWM